MPLRDGPSRYYQVECLCLGDWMTERTTRTVEEARAIAKEMPGMVRITTWDRTAVESGKRFQDAPVEERRAGVRQCKDKADA